MTCNHTGGHMRIFITGDTHGKRMRIEQIIGDIMPECGDIIIICGDWGLLFWDSPHEREYLDFLEKIPFTLCFIDGNHENFHAIYNFPVEVWNGGKVHRIRKNIFHLMRGQVFEIDGRTFFTFGGAYSIDRWRRERNFTYWDEELPNNDEYHEATQNLEAHGMEVDYILTHTVPTSMVYRMGQIPNENEIELTGFLEWILREVRFKHWYSGHWHIDKNLTSGFTVLLNGIVSPGEGANENAV